MALVAKAHQNLTFTTAPNLQRAVAVGLAKDDAYFAALGWRAAGAARPAGGRAATPRLRPCRPRAAISSPPISRPLGFTGDDVAFCRHITEQAG